MNTLRNVLIATTLSVTTLMTPGLVHAETNLISVGVAAKTSTAYSKYSDRVSDALQEYFEGQTPEKSAIVTKEQKEWIDNCQDSDGLDEIEADRTAEGSTIYKYTCYINGEYSKAHVYLAEIGVVSQLVGFQVVEVEKVLNVTQTSNRGFTLKIFAKEGFGTIAAAATSSMLAHQVYPGKANGDKASHAIYSSVMASTFSSIAYHFFGVSAKKAAIIGGLLSCTVGAGKEVSDKMRGGKHVADADDFYADAIGCTTGSLGIYLTF